MPRRTNRRCSDWSFELTCALSAGTVVYIENPLACHEKLWWILYLFCTIRLMFLRATYCTSGSAESRVTRGGESFLINKVTKSECWSIISSSFIITCIPINNNVSPTSNICDNIKNCKMFWKTWMIRKTVNDMLRYVYEGNKMWNPYYV